MREILFRGKRIDNGEWVYGFLYETEKSSSYNAESYILEKERLTINYKCVEGITTHIPFVQVTPETVGQYTGLTDMTGKKIFEGDVVKVENTDHDWHEHDPNSYNVFAVSFDEGGFTAGDYFLQNWLWFDGFHGEVIGNIYDNPEPIKGANV